MILIGRGLDPKTMKSNWYEMREVWMCGFQGTCWIEEKKHDARRLPRKREVMVIKGHDRKPSGEGLRRPFTVFR